MYNVSTVSFFFIKGVMVSVHMPLLLYLVICSLPAFNETAIVQSMFIICLSGCNGRRNHRSAVDSRYILVDVMVGVITRVQ